MTSVVFLDNAHVITAGGDHLVRLWDISSGQEIRQYQGGSGGILQLSLSASGALVAGASNDKNARVWNVESGALLNTFKRKREVSAVALSPDGRMLLMGDFGGKLGLYDLATQSSIPGPTGDCGYAAIFSRDGRRFAFGGGNAAVAVWEAAPFHLLAKFPLGCHVYAVAFSPDGSTLAAGGPGRDIHLWDIASGKERLLQGHTETLRGLAWSADGRVIVSGSDDRTVRLWDPASGREVHRFEGHTRAVHGVAISPDGRLIASAGIDGTVRIWRMP